MSGIHEGVDFPDARSYQQGVRYGLRQRNR